MTTNEYSCGKSIDSGKALALFILLLCQARSKFKSGLAAGSSYDQTEKTVQVFKITGDQLPGSFQ